MHVPGHGLLMCADHSDKRLWESLQYAFTAVAKLHSSREAWGGHSYATFGAGLAVGRPCFPEGCGGAAQVDALVEGVAAQLPGMQRALCTRRTLRHVLLALQEERDALVVDGDDVYFTC